MVVRGNCQEYLTTRGGGGDSHRKVTGMFVFSLRGVRDGKSLYLPIQVSLRALLEEIYKK